MTDKEAIEKIAAKIIVDCGKGSEYPCPHDEPLFGYEKCRHEDKDLCVWQSKQAVEIFNTMKALGYRLPSELPYDKVEAVATGMKRFTMFRKLDISATHDSNQTNPPDEAQFEGVIFSDGRVAIRWLTEKRSVAVWDSMEDMLAIHGHPEYGSVLVWNDTSLINPPLKVRPNIVCLCGSGRFREAFSEAEYNETLAGNIVLTIGCNTHDIAREKDLADYKPMLDELHLRKIDLADEVLILNVGGYIGQSTGNELKYALSKGKKVRYLEAQVDSIREQEGR